MAVKCPSCGEWVESEAEECPSCLLPRKAFEIVRKHKNAERIAENVASQKAEETRSETPPTEEDKSDTPSVHAGEKEDLSEHDTVPESDENISEPIGSNLRLAAPPMEADSPESDDFELEFGGIPSSHSQESTEKRKRPKDFKEIPSESALPADLPESVLILIKKLLMTKGMENLYPWVLKNLQDENKVFSLIETYLQRYEEKALETKSELKDYLIVFQAALVARALQMLPGYRTRFTERGVNPLFLRTWLEKKFLAMIVNQEVETIDLNLEFSALKPTEFLYEKISELLPKTCLSKIEVFTVKKHPDFAIFASVSSGK